MLISGTNETPIIATELPLSESGFLFMPGGPYARDGANHRDPVMPPHLPGGKPGSGPPPGRKFRQRMDLGEAARGAAQRTPTEGRSSVSTEQA